MNYIFLLLFAILPVNITAMSFISRFFPYSSVAAQTNDNKIQNENTKNLNAYKAKWSKLEKKAFDSERTTA